MREAEKTETPMEEEEGSPEGRAARAAAVEETLVRRLQALGPGEWADEMRDRVMRILTCLHERGKWVPLCRLSSCAAVSDEPCLALGAIEMQRRRGRFPHHVRGSEMVSVDDWTLEGPYLLVVACDTVRTREGGLVVLRGEGPASCSPLYHAVVPFEPGDAEYLYGFLRTADAGSLVVGSDVLREIPLTSLRALTIPWPEPRLRALMGEVFASAWAAEEVSAGARHRTLTPTGEAGDGATETAGPSSLRLLLSPSSPESVEALLSLPPLIMALMRLMADGSEHADAAPTVSVQASGRVAEGEGTAVDDRRRMADRGSGMVSRPSRGPLLSGEEASFVFVDAFLGEVDPSCPPIDVVAETEDLARASVGRVSSRALCVPGSTEGAWSSHVLARSDPRWVWGIPPRNRSDYAWLQQTFACLDEEGIGVVLIRNAPLHSSVGADRDMRARMAMSGQMRCVVALPPRLFEDGRPPQSIIVLQRGGPRSSILFVDLQARGVETGGFARSQGIARGEVDRAVEVCRAWMEGRFDDRIPGPWRAVPIREVEEAGQMLAPWDYVDPAAS